MTGPEAGRGQKDAGRVRALRTALDALEGTVTSFLEALAAERIAAEVVLARQVTPPPGHPLGVGAVAGASLAYRVAWLTGSVSGRRYVYAESCFLPERLPRRAAEVLAGGGVPIGRVLEEHGVRLQRVASDPPGSSWPGRPVGCSGAVPVPDAPWTRAYLLADGAGPVFSIGEWFLPAALELVGERAPI